jgi:high-affinity nickel permease
MFPLGFLFGLGFDTATEVAGGLNDNFNDLGFAIIGVFTLAWANSHVIYKVRSFDNIDMPRVNQVYGPDL